MLTKRYAQTSVASVNKVSLGALLIRNRGKNVMSSQKHTAAAQLANLRRKLVGVHRPIRVRLPPLRLKEDLHLEHRPSSARKTH